MSAYFKAALIAASLATAVTVSAQPMSAASAATDCPSNADCRMGKKGHGTRHARRPTMTAEQRMARFDSMVAQQAQTLQITAAQRPQWDAYVQAKKNFFAAKQNMPRQNMSQMAADERAELRARHLEAAAQQARQMANSTKALRNALTPEQRSRFDQMGMRYGKRQGFRQSGQGRGAMMQGRDMGKQVQPATAAESIKR